ncbi:nicotinate-nucleotide adenylyltransferase [Defluviitalea phaphyphila]|uniref:nicotinate-nucleotide adenylyltransferase n=1 Tax=Defluviitalea phaphyphila TaxID=1473580 RepID=UPI0007316DD6|nr:nicotinate-nucleotide adenylyltransferase [Defluviitalea phaphyphila]
MRNINKNYSSLKSLAIMGGTFDPIHYGHLVTAEAVRYKYNIDKVLFMPAGNPPHKEYDKITHSEHRYLMGVLATATNPYFDVSRMEIDRKGVTYTIDTIKSLRQMYGEEIELYFITGADAIKEIFTWKNPEELFKLCTFVAVTRPEYYKEELIEKVKTIRNEYESKIHFLEVPALSISSTDIRNRVKNKMPIKYLVPESVENYIYKFNLYI